MIIIDGLIPLKKAKRAGLPVEEGASGAVIGKRGVGWSGFPMTKTEMVTLY